jgi:hypothetical protein
MVSTGKTSAELLAMSAITVNIGSRADYLRRHPVVAQARCHSDFKDR